MSDAKISAAFAASFSTVSVNRRSAAVKTIELLIDAAPHRVERGGLSSFRLLTSNVLKMLGRRAMLLPVQYAWFEPVLIATIVVFIIDLVGNSIGFGNRFLSALMSAIVFALVFGTLVYFGYGSVSMSVTTTPSATAPAQTQK
jgi:hypothetical protein